MLKMTSLKIVHLKDVPLENKCSSLNSTTL